MNGWTNWLQPHFPRVKIAVFGIYTYLERILWFLINLLPKFARKIFYKILFKKIGSGVFIDEGCYFRYPWKISLGDHVVINRGCCFYPAQHNRASIIDIQNDVIIAPGVTFFGAGQDPESPSNKDVSSSIFVGNNAYLGGNSTIRYGVSIGSFAVVGAGAVVVKSVPPKVLVAGNPAKFIRSLSD